eukprot:TRINITY_DN17383_c0_g1_i1.p1 TRINITY_DN17383_c0_g1~~TRINITY_DN17383_c0_g1_i1.p1  ORF type:complete len:622 (+),score=130.88 TRINITY_DN17383_c0_g1_i1:106-1971(+)
MLRLPSAMLRRSHQGISRNASSADVASPACSVAGSPTPARRRGRKLTAIRRQGFFRAHPEPERLADFYELEKTPLGEGAFGSVRLARLRGAPDVVRAVKTVRRRCPKVADQVRREVDILRRLDHPHICRIFETFEEDSDIYLVMEHVDGKELFDYIREEGVLSEEFSRDIVRQLFCALRYCHARKVVHRDIKPENIMVSSGSDASSGSAAAPQVKIVDWGLAAVVRSTDARPTRKLVKSPSGTFIGTYEYLAPEVRSDPRLVEPAADMWSMGMVLHTLLLGDLAPDSVLLGDEILDVSQKPYDGLSATALDLLQGLLQVNPSLRLSAAAAGASAWVTQREGVAPGTTEEEGSLDPAAVSTAAAFLAFRQSTTLRRAALTAVAQHANSSQLAELREQFFRVDTDGNGRISREELTRWLARTGRDLEKAAELVECVFDFVDTDGSQFIEFTEFCAACLDARTQFSDEALRAAFRAFGAESKGSVGAEELSRFISRSSNSEGRSQTDLQEIELDFEGFKQLIARQSFLADEEEVLASVHSISAASCSSMGKIPSDVTVSTTASWGDVPRAGAEERMRRLLLEVEDRSDQEGDDEARSVLSSLGFSSRGPSKTNTSSRGSSIITL